MTLFADFNSSVNVPFQRMRVLLQESGGGLQEGVAGVAAGGELRVIQRGAGANLSTDVAFGAAWVQIDTGTRNGLGHVYNDATFNAGPFSAGNATNPRIDQVVLRWNDTSIPTGAGNAPTIEVITGTATAGATLDNRLGAAALPNDCMRLADVLMPVSAASVTTANIRDRRPWARGAFMHKAAAAGSPTTFATGTAINLNSALDGRLELSGAPVRVTIRGAFNNNTANTWVAMEAWADGAAIAWDAAEGGAFARIQTITAGIGTTLAASFVYKSPTPGTHIFRAMGSNSAGTVTPSSIAIAVEESVRPGGVVDNGTT